MLIQGGHWSNVDWKLNSDDDGGGCTSKRGRGYLFSLARLMMVLFLGQLWTTSGVSASFNLFMDRSEAQKLLGLPSDIFYVREGVVNEYALNFIVKVPAAVEFLVFAWQATTKRSVQYDMTLEFTDFFALLSPSSNISQTGRVPQKLESFRISLPCSGRINAEVAVNIRFTFQLKHFKGSTSSSSNNSIATKGNTTTINLKRNKICLLKEFIPSVEEPLAIGTKAPTSPPKSTQILDKSSGDLKTSGSGSGSGSGTTTSGGGSSSGPSVVSNSTLLLFQDPTPSLLLAGLLGGCVVTASIVFLIFFICLRRKLVPSSPLSSAYSSGGGIINSDPNSSNNSSPACLLRQSTGMGESKWTSKDESCCDSNEFKEKYLNPNSTIASRNSYVTIASFWNDIFGTGNSQSHPQCNSTPSGSQHHHHGHQQHQRIGSSSGHSHSNVNVNVGRFHGSSISSHRPPPPAYPQILQHTNYHLNSTFNSPQSQNNSTNPMMTKGADVSPYAYAHIVPKIAPPPPPLIEWYSESTCNNGGHIFTNNLYTFQQSSNPNPGQNILQHSSPAHLSNPATTNNSNSGQPPPLPKSRKSQNSLPDDGNACSTTRSAGSGSLIQIDGFQCRKNLVKDGNIVERFL